MSQPTSMERERIVEQLGAAGTDQVRLLEEARRARKAQWGDRVVVRGVIEVTNRCRVNCDYCPMRRDNTSANDTYVMSASEILTAAERVREAGINIVFLQGGEIPQTTELVGDVIPRIKDLFAGEVELLLCLGNKSREEYAYLKDQGADSYILKHETANPQLHLELRYESLADRLRHLESLLELGFKVGTGTIVGLPGQTPADLADDLLLALDLGVHMFSASPFVPAPDTPMESLPPGSVQLTLNLLAAARLANPGWLIPSVSALEKLETNGQGQGIEAGANILTVNFTSAMRQKGYLIYGEDRYVVRSRHVSGLISRAGLVQSGSCWVGQ